MLPASPGSTYNQYKVVLLGDAGVGKSCLVKTLKCGCESWKDRMEYNPTVGSCITNHCIPGVCRLYIIDTSGSLTCTSLVKQYLSHLDCVIFVFALDEPASLKGLHQWVDLFETEFNGDSTQVQKFVFGTKMDAGSQLRKQVQEDALALSKEINAEFCTTSAKTPANVDELFTRIGETLVGQPPCFQVPPTAYKPEGDCYDSRKNALILNDTLVSPGAFLRYPDPVAIDTGNSIITNISLGHQNLVMYGEDEELTWGTDLEQHLQEPVLKVKPLPAVNLHSVSTIPVNPLNSCVSSKNSASTWQHKYLSGHCVLGITVKRQATCTQFSDIKEMLFCSSKRDGSERDEGLFYMLMLTTNDTLLECGLKPVTAAQEAPENDYRDFTLTPRPLILPNNNKIKSMSMSNTHTVVAGDGTVQMWGGWADLRTTSPTPDVSLNLNVIKVACGIDFTLMLSSDGKVYSYGRGELGQLGHGDEEDKAIPTKIEGLSNILDIGAGNHHAAAVSGGFLYQWGLKCDDPALKQFETKPTVCLKDRTTVTSVSCGAHHTMCIARGYYLGVPYSWGTGTRGQLGHGDAENRARLRCIYSLYQASKVVQKISSGKNHSAFLTTKGEVFTCGCNQFGQLGYFTEQDHSTIPQKVDLGRNADNAEIRAKEMSCSEDCTMVLTKNNRVLIWGRSFYGPRVDNTVPADVASSRIIDVATCSVWCGTVFTELVFALTEARTLVLCGADRSNVDFQALSAIPPSNVHGLVSITSVGSVLLALNAKGKMYCADSQAWCQYVLSSGSASLPKDLPHALGSSFRSLKCSNSMMPPFNWTACLLPDNVTRVEATLDTFFFTTVIGDVCSWKPFSIGNIERHTELDDSIIIQIACGMQHAAVLTEEGVVLTCGNGCAGQLGHGTFESVWKFQPVSLTETFPVITVSCGSASTAVLSRTGKVFFWGQLDLPEHEKDEMKNQVLKTAMGTQLVTYRLSLMTSEYTTDPNAAYVLMLDNDEEGHQIAVVGRPFEFHIGTRNGGVHDMGVLEKVIRVEACSLTDKPTIRVKGKVKQDAKSAHKASILFLKEDMFQVTATIDNRHILGSPFIVHVEKGVLPSRCKVTLVGQNLAILRSVEDALQQNEDCDFFRDTELKVQLWGVPGINDDQATYHAATLTSVTDMGLYAYVWDSFDGNLPDVDLKYWLQTLSVKAPHAEVLLLILNISSGLAKRLDLKPFQDINPNLKRAVLVGSSYRSKPAILLKEMKPILEEKVHFSQEMVWFRAEDLAANVQQERDDGLETLSKKCLKSLARKCGIHSEYHFTMAARYLEEAGLGLITGEENVFIILQEKWLVRNLLEFSGSCHHGALDAGNLAGPKKCIAQLLIKKQLAVTNEDQTRIHVVSSMEPLPKEVWSSTDSIAFTTSRHLVFKVQPYTLHTTFPRLVLDVVKKYPAVSIGMNSLVIHDAKYKCRVDCGPSFVDRCMSEVRVVVRADSQENCGRAADAVLASLCEIGDFPQTCHSIKLSCSVCLLQYIDQSDVIRAENQGESEVRCHGCMKSVVVNDLQQGYKENRAMPDLKWSASSECSANPEFAVRPLVQPVIQYLDERLHHQEQRLLSTIREEFTDMIKLIEEHKECTVPRTVILRPDVEKFQSLPDKLRSYVGPQLKWRLFLLCEGNGDGLGIHFLDIKDHKGYELRCSNEFILKHAGHLRLVLQLLLSYAAPNAAVIAAGLEAVGLMSIFPSQETLDGILGVVGLNAATVKRDWKKYLKEMDQFLKSVEENAQSSNDPKGLAGQPGTARQYNMYSCDYKHLQVILSELGKKDDFGGLVKEFRKGVGFVWVCKQHRKHTSDITIEAI